MSAVMTSAAGKGKRESEKRPKEGSAGAPPIGLVYAPISGKA